MRSHWYALIAATLSLCFVSSAQADDTKTVESERNAIVAELASLEVDVEGMTDDQIAEVYEFFTEDATAPKQKPSLVMRILVWTAEQIGSEVDEDVEAAFVTLGIRGSLPPSFEIAEIPTFSPQ